MHGHEWFHFPFFWIFPLAMIVLFFFMFRRRRNSRWCGFGSRCDDSDHPQTRESASDILARRYARGEIDRAEYEECIKVLEDEQATPIG